MFIPNHGKYTDAKSSGLKCALPNSMLKKARFISGNPSDLKLP